MRCRTDSLRTSCSNGFNIQVNERPALSISIPYVTDFTVKSPGSVTATARNVIGTPTYSLSTRRFGVEDAGNGYRSTSLPTDLTFDSAAGRIAGSVAVSGSGLWVGYQMNVADAHQSASSNWFVMRVADRAPLGVSVPTTVRVPLGASVSFAPATVAHAAAPPSYTLQTRRFGVDNTGEFRLTSLPTGLGLDLSTGVVSGTATQPGLWTGYRICANDGERSACSNGFVFIVE